MYTIIGFIALACLAGVIIMRSNRKEEPTSDDGCCDDHAWGSDASIFVEREKVE